MSIQAVIRAHFEANDAASETITWAEIQERLESETVLTATPAPNHRRLWVVVAASVLTLLLIGLISVLTSSQEIPPADTVVPSTIEEPTPTTTSQPTPPTTVDDAAAVTPISPPSPAEIAALGIDQTDRLGLPPIGPGVETVYWIGQTHGEDLSRQRIHVVRIEPGSRSTAFGVVGDKDGPYSPRGGPAQVSAAAGELYLWLGWHSLGSNSIRLVGVDYETLIVEVSYTLDATEPIFDFGMGSQGGVVWLTHSETFLYRLDEANPDDLIQVDVDFAIKMMSPLGDGSVLVAGADLNQTRGDGRIRPDRAIVMSRSGATVWSVDGIAEYVASPDKIYQLGHDGDLSVYDATTGTQLRALATDWVGETNALKCCLDGMLVGRNESFAVRTESGGWWPHVLLDPLTGQSMRAPWNEREPEYRAEFPTRLWIDQDVSWHFSYDLNDLNGWAVPTPEEHFDHSDAVVVNR